MDPLTATRSLIDGQDAGHFNLPDRFVKSWKTCERVRSTTISDASTRTVTPPAPELELFQAAAETLVRDGKLDPGPIIAARGVVSIEAVEERVIAYAVEIADAQLHATARLLGREILTDYLRPAVEEVAGALAKSKSGKTMQELAVRWNGIQTARTQLLRHCAVKVDADHFEFFRDVRNAEVAIPGVAMHYPQTVRESIPTTSTADWLAWMRDHDAELWLPTPREQDARWWDVFADGRVNGNAHAEWHRQGPAW